jgi:hypothetical protein
MFDQMEARAHRGTLMPWPYPLLCLAWRLGWGSRRLVEPEEARSRANESARSAAGIAASCSAANEVDVEHHACPGAGESGTTVDRIEAMLRSSPMMSRHGTPATSVLAATVSLIRVPPAQRRNFEIPPFWRPAFACWSGFRTPCHVPSPRPRWDPATWTLIGLFEGIWDTTGTTLLGRERPIHFQVAGTRRMAARYGWSTRRALACGRTAHRIWRHWFVTREAPRLAAAASLPVPPALRYLLPDMAGAYRHIRTARRTGRWTPDLEALPSSCRAMLSHLADASVRELQPPVIVVRPPGLREAVARSLLASPLGCLAAQSGLDTGALRAAAEQTAARLLWLLTAPWPWTPRPVVHGPRRARQEARARAVTR